MSFSEHDGFEGMAYLVYALAAVAIPAFLAPLIAVIAEVTGGPVAERSRLLWWSLAAYCVSLGSGLRCVPLLLTDRRTSVEVFILGGTLAALIALVLAFKAKGAGRTSAILAASYLSVLWLPFIWGRVLKR